MLAVLEQNPHMQWSDLISEVFIEEEKPSDIDEIAVNRDEGGTGYDGLTTFKL